MLHLRWNARAEFMHYGNKTLGSKIIRREETCDSHGALYWSRGYAALRVGVWVPQFESLSHVWSSILWHSQYCLLFGSMMCWWQDSSVGYWLDSRDSSPIWGHRVLHFVENDCPLSCLQEPATEPLHFPTSSKIYLKLSSYRCLGFPSVFFLQGFLHSFSFLSVQHALRISSSSGWVF
jgi:hypothetical protein